MIIKLDVRKGMCAYSSKSCY